MACVRAVPDPHEGCYASVGIRSPSYLVKLRMSRRIARKHWFYRLLKVSIIRSCVQNSAPFPCSRFILFDLLLFRSHIRASLTGHNRHSHSYTALHLRQATHDLLPTQCWHHVVPLRTIRQARAKHAKRDAGGVRANCSSSSPP